MDLPLSTGCSTFQSSSILSSKIGRGSQLPFFANWQSPVVATPKNVIVAPSVSSRAILAFLNMSSKQLLHHSFRLISVQAIGGGWAKRGRAPLARLE
eukprot:CAMPEP_0117503132 /NCGR_PEP_ID=MMETSP0784-20121206/24169_1 /TAXON_ID=39447 /ORGANISM="" /LENGTH=96 /DNA_ID=CAMNT_0005298433 /DNA_START=535 /DNA_END=822 /DNA_ORIENTATION=+